MSFHAGNAPGDDWCAIWERPSAENAVFEAWTALGINTNLSSGCGPARSDPRELDRQRHYVSPAPLREATSILRAAEGFHRERNAMAMNLRQCRGEALKLVHTHSDSGAGGSYDETGQGFTVRRMGWERIGRIYQAAVVLYCLASQPQRSDHVRKSSQWTTLRAGLLQDLRDSSLDAYLHHRKLVLWPLTILGLVLDYDDGGTQQFVLKELKWASAALGTATPLVAMQLLERTWRSRQSYSIIKDLELYHFRLSPLRTNFSHHHADQLANPIFVATHVSAGLISPTTHPLILADTNRDGIVNGKDITEKYTWTNERGAIFLPNIGDKHRRCAAFDLNGLPLSNQELSSCNDASGHLLLAPELAAPARTAPLDNISEEATGNIYTLPESTLGSVRVFWKQPGFLSDEHSPWRLVDPQFMFNATSLRAGIELAIDARELVSDLSAWNGTLTLEFRVTDGNMTTYDAVAMKQAPVLFHHHLQRVQMVISGKGNETSSPVQQKFVRGLEDALMNVTDTLSLHLLNGTYEIWAQDFMEPGFASMPGPEGPISLRVLMRSAQSTRVAGRQVFESFRGDRVGGHQPSLGSGFGHEEIDSGGNIEIIPPYVSKNRTSYTHGRVIMGKHFDKHPAKSVTSLIEAQIYQSPLFLEAGWLVIGHVDEFVQFLPYQNDLGWTIAIADTQAPLASLRKAQDSGHGSTLVTSYPNLRQPEGFSFSDSTFSFYDPRLENLTIDTLLSDDDFLQTQKYAQKYIDHNLGLLLEEVPLPHNEVLRIPALYKNVTYPWPSYLDGLPPRLHRVTPGQSQLIAFLPAAINGVVIGSDYVAAKPWGPIVDDQDIFEEAVRDVYGQAGMKVHFVDDFMSHHVNGGEVHCGTNTLRDTRVKWWS
uniref:Protein-arginine deiminase C-terminal domain-containing protein n=1 Tax=Fusarium oxysporum (strain Fo5176) TaxID=660025 RepID=A0A0D2YJF3_FUSOF